MIRQLGGILVPKRVSEKSWVNPKTVGAKHSGDQFSVAPRDYLPNASPLRNDNGAFQTRSKISPEIIKIKYFDEISREKISIKIFKSVS
jgi:hypothetical protein